MPNGADKNLIRFLGAVDGFRSSYGRWPESVRIHPESLQNLREHVLTKESFATVCAKVRLIPDEDARIDAEDAEGNRYSYGEQGFPKERPTPRAEEWFGVELRPDLW